MPDVIRHFCKLFADDSKLIAVIKNVEDENQLQSDLDELCKWSIKWKMLFNFSKCKVMQVGKNADNMTREYHMTDYQDNKIVLANTKSERDLGIQIKSDLKSDEQVNLAVKKANQALEF